MLQFSLTKKFTIIGLCVLGLLLAMPNFFYSKVEMSNDAEVVLDGGIAAAGATAGLTPEELQSAASAWPT
jgi:preprotein translocase subunit SecD